MSLTKPSLLDIVKRQSIYKLKAYLGLYNRLVFSQILAILFSLNGIGGMSGSSGSMEVNVHYYSIDFVVGFSILWAFITAIMITTKAIRNGDFLFVTNRLSSNLSNLFFLLTASLIGSITAMLSTFVLKVIVYYFMGRNFIVLQGPMSPPIEMLLGILTITLYLFLFCTLGYLVGLLVQVYKGFVILVPAIFIASLFLRMGNNNEPFITPIYTFFFMESSLPLFIVKVVVTASALFAFASVLSNKMEVKQ